MCILHLYIYFISTFTCWSILKNNNKGIIQKNKEGKIPFFCYSAIKKIEFKKKKESSLYPFFVSLWLFLKKEKIEFKKKDDIKNAENNLYLKKKTIKKVQKGYKVFFFRIEKKG